MVYRQNELAVQWDASCRQAMTPSNADMFLQFKTKEICEAAPPCDVAVRVKQRVTVKAMCTYVSCARRLLLQPAP